jgi:hypothetical protein
MSTPMPFMAREGSRATRSTRHCSAVAVHPPPVGPIGSREQVGQESGGAVATDARTDEPLVDVLGSVHSLLLDGPGLEDLLVKLAGMAAKVVDPPASCGRDDSVRRTAPNDRHQ